MIKWLVAGKVAQIAKAGRCNKGREQYQDSKQSRTDARKTMFLTELLIPGR